MNNKELNTSLKREAFELLVAAYDNPSRKLQLDAWSKKSPAHERAMLQAKQDWDVIGRVEDISLSGFDSVKLAIQLRLARFTENTFQLSSALTIAAVLIAIFYYGINTSQHVISKPDAVLLTAQTPTVKPKAFKIYRTSKGQQRTTKLKDGSKVWLDWNTELRVHMTDSKREILLDKGKAFFSVASDLNRPFSVVSEHAVATALGTEFTVHRLDNKTVEVEVLEGVVSVLGEDAQASKRLGVSDVVRIKRGKTGKITNRPVAELGAWRNGILVFEQRSLIEALETLEPYTSYKIDTRHIFTSKKSVSGTFLINKGDEALRAIMHGYRLDGELIGKNTLVLRSLPPTRPR